MGGSTNIHLIRMNPYDPNLGVLVPIVAKRIMAYSQEHAKEVDPVLATRNIMVPLWSQDPLMLVLAMVNTDGAVVGHAVGAVQGDGLRHSLIISQTQADGAVGDAVLRSLDYAREWVAREIDPLLTARGLATVDKMVLVTGKNEKAWERDYGFRLDRRVLSLSLGHGGKEVSGE